MSLREKDKDIISKFLQDMDASPIGSILWDESVYSKILLLFPNLFSNKITFSTIKNNIDYNYYHNTADFLNDLKSIEINCRIIGENAEEIGETFDKTRNICLFSQISLFIQRKYNKIQKSLNQEGFFGIFFNLRELFNEGFSSMPDLLFSQFMCSNTFLTSKFVPSQHTLFKNRRTPFTVDKHPMKQEYNEEYPETSFSNYPPVATAPIIHEEQTLMPNSDNDENDSETDELTLITPFVGKISKTLTKKRDEEEHFVQEEVKPKEEEIEIPIIKETENKVKEEIEIPQPHLPEKQSTHKPRKRIYIYDKEYDFNETSSSDSEEFEEKITKRVRRKITPTKPKKKTKEFTDHDADIFMMNMERVSSEFTENVQETLANKMGEIIKKYQADVDFGPNQCEPVLDLKNLNAETQIKLNDFLKRFYKTHKKQYKEELSD